MKFSSMWSRRLLAVGLSASAFLAAGGAQPAYADTQISVPIPSASAAVLCGVGQTGLGLHLTAKATTTGFTATSTALLCGGNAIETAIQMTFVGAGNSGASGAPIIGAPFAIVPGNTASVTGSAVAPSATNQTVLVNVVATSVVLGSEFQAECQAVVELLLGSPISVQGC